MIAFQYNSELYNHIIHHFMEVEELYKETKMKSFLKRYANPLLVKEQYAKCIDTLNELFYWTEDREIHIMEAFHEVILYNFLNYMTYLQNILDDFNKKYFDKKGLDMITSLAKKEQKETPYNSLESIKELYFDISNYGDNLFFDEDFVYIEELCNYQTFKDNTLIKQLGININYYFDILPKDIRDKYKTGNLTLSGEIADLIDYLKEEIECRDLYKLFWNKNKSLELSQIKIILDNIILFYFQKQEIDICWHIKETKDSIKFIFNKKREEKTKVLLEIIDINKRELSKGLKDKLFDEVKNYDNAFFIFLASTINEKNKIINFISKYIYTKNIITYLNVNFFDYHKRRAVSVK